MHIQYFYSTIYNIILKFGLTPQTAAVVITFFVCWFPFHLQRLWYLYAKNNDYYYYVNEWLFSIAGFAYYITW